MTQLLGRVSPEEEQQFYDNTESAGLRASWMGRRLERKPQVEPFAWRWEQARPLILRSGDIVTPDRDVERRVLTLKNPGLDYGTTHTMVSALQLLLPGRERPGPSPHTHGHPLGAAGHRRLHHGGRRQVLHGARRPGADPFMDLARPQQRGQRAHDLAGRAGRAPGQHAGRHLLRAVPEDQQPIVGVGESVRKYASGTLRPAWEDTNIPYSPLWHYKWEQTHAALRNLAETVGNPLVCSDVDSRITIAAIPPSNNCSPFDDVAMEFSDPATGGPVLRTLACWIQLIRPGINTRAHRHTSSAVYQVFRGQGHSVINGQRFDWGEGDFLVVPSWAWHEHANDTDDEAILFSIQDIPVMKSLSLYREEPYTENAGHQPITSVFEG